MGIFNLTDVRVSSDPSRIGVGKRLTGQGSYDSNIYRYPLDIGNTDKGHYIVFHINVQDETKWGYAYTGDRPTIFERGGIPPLYKNVGTTGGIVTDGVTTLYKGFKKVGQDLDIKDSTKLQAITEEGAKIGETFIKTFASGKTARSIKRTTDTVVLYMPDNGVTFTNSQAYSELSLQGTIAAVSAGGSSLKDLLHQGVSTELFGKALGNIAPYLLSMAANKDGTTKALFAAGTGFVQNPMLEIIYSSPAFRTFTFDFMMYPRSKKESEEMMKLIERLRFHQAPEIHRQFNGFFMVPPSEFDIKFYCNGAENPNIDRISTCVLESITVDYAPNGFTAYEVPGEFTPTVGGTGAPVAVQLSLQFKELQVLTKDDYSGSNAIGTIPLTTNTPTTKV